VPGSAGWSRGAGPGRSRVGLLAELPRKNCRTIAEHAGDRTPATPRRPARPPDPATNTRLGTILAELRQAAGLDPASLATARWAENRVTEAENGTWQPRDFWNAMDTALGADGSAVTVPGNSGTYAWQ
jgi:hypothetical protein